MLISSVTVVLNASLEYWLSTYDELPCIVTVAAKPVVYHGVGPLQATIAA